MSDGERGKPMIKLAIETMNEQRFICLKDVFKHLCRVSTKWTLYYEAEHVVFLGVAEDHNGKHDFILDTRIPNTRP